MEIIEKGKHDKLMKKESYYKKLVESQGQTALSKRKSSVVAVGADGITESQRGFDKVPEELVDTNAAPLFVFRNVNFTYPTRPGRTILDNFKLKTFGFNFQKRGFRIEIFNLGNLVERHYIKRYTLLSSALIRFDQAIVSHRHRKV